MVRKSRGFTIVEIVVVVTVIAILTAIITFGFLYQQARARDSERLASAQIISESLEKYFDKNGEYPPCPDITDTASNVTANTLVGIDKAALLAPQDRTGTTNSIKCNDLTNLSQPDFFAYIGDGSSNCQTGDACLSFRLKYKEEAENRIGAINSRRNTNIATSGTPVLTATTTGFTSANISWTGVKNSLSYTMEYATDSGFTQNVISLDYTGVNTTLNTLSYDTTYYFRVKANSVNGAGDWSATKNITTRSLATPTASVSTTSSTSFRATWNAISYAAGYVAQCSYDGTNWGTGCLTGTITPTIYNFTGANQGTRYYVRVKAVSGSYESAWSNAPSTITTIDGPAPYGLYSDNTLPNWNYLYGRSDAVCPAGTTPSYDWYSNGGFWVSGAQHRAVNHSLGWNGSVTLSVASRCTTALTSSGFVWANNTASMSLPWPSTSTWLPGDGTMHWSGTCPKWTTSNNFYWRTNGRLAAAGNTWQSETSSPPIWYTGYSWWGNGRAYVTLSCTGPWGTATAEANSMYGPGCVPTPTVAECWQ